MQNPINLKIEDGKGINPRKKIYHMGVLVLVNDASVLKLDVELLVNRVKSTFMAKSFLSSGAPPLLLFPPKSKSKTLQLDPRPCTASFSKVRN
ncbi:uncharacterized protein DS421_3g74560 [Arachis hypogaea]|nr:uncharacterized protein DS421_3g74560 [Arachis hypogaea]